MRAFAEEEPGDRHDLATRITNDGCQQQGDSDKDDCTHRGPARPEEEEEADRRALSDGTMFVRGSRHLFAIRQN